MWEQHKVPSYLIWIFPHMKLCLAIATHNFRHKSHRSEYMHATRDTTTDTKFAHDCLHQRQRENRSEHTFLNNNTPHGEQRRTVLIRQLLHTVQWQHATQWATPNCFNQTKCSRTNSCKQSILTRNVSFSLYPPQPFFFIIISPRDKPTRRVKKMYPGNSLENSSFCARVRAGISLTIIK